MDRCERKCPSGINLGPSFSVYINDLADGLSSNSKLFADDTSLFSVIHNLNISANELNNDFYQINEWAFQFKMSFNPDPSEQAQEIIFIRKTKNNSHPSFFLQSPYKMHLGIFLDAQLTFEEHLKVAYTKVNKSIRLIRFTKN